MTVQRIHQEARYKVSVHLKRKSNLVGGKNSFWSDLLHYRLANG